MAESSHKSDWSVDNTVQMMLQLLLYFLPEWRNRQTQGT